MKKPCIALMLAAMLLVVPLNAASATSVTLSCVRTAPSGFVCLTIDDGYGRDKIKKDLDVLRAYKVHCTFFVIGAQLLAYRDLWRQAVEDGHEICYHTMFHHTLSSWSDAQILLDLEIWSMIARHVLGRHYRVPKFARLPGGAGSSNQRILRLFQSRGYRVIYWSMDTLTGAVNRHWSIDGYIKANTRTGSIILTHFNSYDAQALPKYIGWLKSHFKLGTLSQAFAS